MKKMKFWIPMSVLVLLVVLTNCSSDDGGPAEPPVTQQPDPEPEPDEKPDGSADEDSDGITNGDEDLNGDDDFENDDTDGDGTPDYKDNDDDGDGIPTASEGPGTDTDGDAVLDYLDNDDDGDGVPTATEGATEDTDGDAVLDYLDNDDDGDGVISLNEDLDADADPTNDDTDGDGTPNYLDADDDGDGIATLDEDTDGDGDVTNDDSDGDGVPDYLDGAEDVLSIANLGFEDFGTQEVAVYRIANGAFNGTTCSIDNDEKTFNKNITSLNRPLGFSTTDDYFEQDAFYVTQATGADVNSGDSAVKLISDSGFFAPVAGVVGLFEPEDFFQDFSPVAYPFTKVPTAITGFYKHVSGDPVSFPEGTCTSQGQLSEETEFSGGFRVYAVMTNDAGTIIATVDTVFEDVADYTAFSAPVTVLVADEVPTNIIFVMSSSPEFIAPNPIPIAGSVTFIDDVSFTFD